MTRLRPLAWLFLAAIIAFVVAPVAAQSPTPVLGASVDAPNGQTTYDQYCAACHGATGQGDGESAAQLEFPPTRLGDFESISSSSIAELFEVTKSGRMERMMPPWGDKLSDQELWDTVAYVWTLHTSLDEVADGKVIYTAFCQSCHGVDGKGTEGIPDLSDFVSTSAVPQSDWIDLLETGRGTMPAFGEQLDVVQRRAVLEYVRSLSMGRLFREPLPAGTGVISGTIVNVTTGQPLAAVTVTLGIFDSTALLDQLGTQTDANGYYRFENLPSRSDLTFLARTEYPAGMPYSSDAVGFPDGEDGLDLPVRVYDTTTDASGIRADRVHFIVEFDAAQASIVELVVFSLEGNRAYIGDGTGVLRFSLPEGATDLEISDGALGARYVGSDGGFVDTLPLLPGDGVRQLLYRYLLPLEDGSMVLERQFEFPVTAVNVLIADSGEKVSSTMLTQQASRQTQNGNYFSLVGQDIAAGETISFQVEDAGGTVSLQGNALNTSPALLFVILGVVVAGAGYLVLLPALRRSSPANAAANRPRTTDAVIDALARLDLAYERGEIGEASHRDQRLQLRAQLADLMRKDGSA